MSNETRLRDAWARADNTKAREIAAHERAILLHEAAAVRFDQLGDDAAAATVRGRARAAWQRLQDAHTEQATALALRAEFSN